MGRNDGPDESIGTPSEDGRPNGNDDQPDGLSLFDDARPGPDRRKDTHRVLRTFVGLGVLLVVALLLVGWTRLSHSDALCSSCHEIAPAAQAKQRSVHASLSCLSCHVGPGLTGSLRYVPTLLRETIDEFTGWDIAHGVLEPRTCESCHSDLAATPELAAAHREGANCTSCHGDVAHPPLRLVGFARPVDGIEEGDVHPKLFVQTHGDDVVRDPESCAECHEKDYCETCHLRETYPHPDGWIELHGPTQIDLGPTSCEGCHAPTFCIGCHGTEIPHNVRWLGEHWRTLQDAGTGPCLLCHPKTDCTDCHAKHQVHREQSLYA